MRFNCRSVFNGRVLLILLISLLLTGCAGFRPNINIPKNAPVSPRPIQQHPKVAIVLGGGGARGYAHLGVLDVLQKAGVPINLVVGASAGSIVGALYADSGNAERATTIMMKAGFWDFADISNFPSTKGVVEGYHLEKFLLRNMHARKFSQLKIPLIVATTDLYAGKVYPISTGPVAPAVEASAAVPAVVQPAHLYGHTLIDGGMADPIPVDLARRYHPRVIIAVDIDQQLAKRHPNDAIAIYDRGYMISWKRLAQMSMRGANIIIRPRVGQIGMFDLDEKQELFRLGQQAARQALPKILRLLKKKHIPLVKPTA